MDRIKVLHLSSELTWRGGEQQIAYLIDELKKSNVINMVFCRKKSAFEKYCIDHQILFKNAAFTNSVDLVSAYKLSVWVKEIEPDIIHTHSARSHAIAMLATRFGMKTDIIVSKRTDFDIKNNFLSRWRYNHKQVKKILCVSGKIAEIVKAAVTNPSKVEVVYSGIDSALLHARESRSELRIKYGIPTSKFLVGNTSALASQKDYFTFIDTIKLIAKDDPNIHFLIIGTGPMESIIREYAINQKVKNFVTFTGFIPDIKYKIHELDCFFITSKTEGLGTSILDAFAARVPVVATQAGGIPELVIHQKTGLLSKIKDANALAQNLLRIKSDKDLRERLTENAIEHLKENFLKEITAKKTLDFYKELIK